MPQRTLAASSRADRARLAEQHPMPAHRRRQPVCGWAGPLVNAAAVQQDDHLAAEMTQQGAEKDDDLDRGDVGIGMQMHIEPGP